MFNLGTVGSGLGGSPSKLLAWGLGLWELAIRRRSKRQFEEPALTVQIREEDEEILQIISGFLFLEGI